jgi:hypothetical protein
MKVIFLVLSLAAAAIAAPTSEPIVARGDDCKPATYKCASNPGNSAQQGWAICDVTGNFVVSFYLSFSVRSVHREGEQTRRGKLANLEFARAIWGVVKRI